MRPTAMNRIMILMLCVGMVFALTAQMCFAAMGYKGPKEIPGQKIKAASITGEVSQVRPSYLGIITKKDKENRSDTEMLFILDEDVIFTRKAADELVEGDQVKVTYQNVTKPDPEDETQQVFVRRITLEVQFLRSKSTSLKSGKK